MAQGIPICWLYPTDPGPFPEPFIARPTDSERFLTWYRVLFSIREVTTEHLTRTWETYSFILSSNPKIFDFDWSEAKTSSPLHQRLKTDMTKFFKDLAPCYDLPATAAKLDFIASCFGRMFLFLEFNSVEYHKSYIDVLVPIFHVAFYGLWAWPGIEFEYRNVEALAATALVRFLSAPPFEFLKLLSDADQIKEFTQLFLSKLLPFQLFQTRRSFAKLPFLADWTRHLFGTDLDLEQVIEIWDWMMHAIGPRTFYDALAALCAAVAVEMRSESSRGDSDELVEILKDLEKLQVPQMLARAALL